MNSIPDDATTEDPRLLQAVQEYLAEVEAGQRPDRRAFASRYPDLSTLMIPYLEALDAVQAATPLLQQQSAGRPPVTNDADVAEPLGDFRIVREIGRGGMGVVYEAIQLSLGRKVALKVLPFAAALDTRQLQRFKNEAQAAAHLHHTNIVPVYAVGTERGVHYYAMQLIEGDNLATVIEVLRRGAPASAASGEARPGLTITGPYRSLSEPGTGPVPDTQPILGSRISTERTNRPGDFFRTVARFGAQVAEGLDYAHSLGVVHRDIKPANILIDALSNVWITDFGLAQFHADAGLTQTGDLVGTLRYMSPEQAGGQHVLHDHRTDIYSLGATLYELLTLRPIFEGQDRQVLLGQIMNEEPRLPRSHDRSIPSELETIVLKATAKAPPERYATAHELADDLNRYLRDEPIQARRPTLTQRARKWLRRHPSVPIAGAVLLVLLAAGSLVSAGFIRSAYKREQQRTREAEERFQLAREAADDLIQLAANDLAGKPFVEEVRKQVLEKALVYYQRFIEATGDDPDAQADLADTQARIEKILEDLAFMQGTAQLELLNQKAVLEDLRPSIEQEKRIVELAVRLRDQRGKMFHDFRRLTEKERDQRNRDLARANETEVAGVLTQGQRRRLGQIDLQLKGPNAFREVKVVRELKLTPEKKVRIEAILMTELSAGMGGPGPGRFGKGPPGDQEPNPRGGLSFDEMRKAFEEKRKKVSERIQAELTRDQRKQWQEMTGEPFKGQLERPMGGFFPGPRPFGPRRPEQ